MAEALIHVPEGLGAVKHISVALLTPLLAKAYVVCLTLSVNPVREVSREGYNYHVVIAVLERDRAVEVREEDELWVFERPVERRKFLRLRSHSCWWWCKT